MVAWVGARLDNGGLMTTQTSKNIGWKRAMTVVAATGALAAGVSAGFAAPTAFAAPSDTTAVASGDSDAPPPITPDQALAMVSAEYDTGAGGGQVSNLIHSIMKLRAQGFQPSNGNGAAIVEALDHRPNQQPLIEALQATLTTQRRNQARSQAASVPPSSVSIGQNQPGNEYDPNGNRNQDAGGITITQPVG
jgi:hypothetical protein